MPFKKMIKIGGFKYNTQPKMGSSNVMYGVFLNNAKKTKKKGKSNGKKRS